MANVTNKNKTPVIDEDLLNQTPPDINAPQDKEGDEPVEPKEEEHIEIPEDKEQQPDKKEELDNKEVDEPELDKKQEYTETPDQKEQRYKSQQTEAQIQAAKNKDLIDKVDQASKIQEPTVDDLKSFVAQDGVQWDDLTPFEQSMAKKTYLSEKRFDLVNQAVQSTKKIDEWATKVDTFIDSTDGKTEYVQLSSHEADFRKFAMKESHRGTPIDILLSAFLHNLGPVKKSRGSMFETTGGGEKPANPTKITEVEQVQALRTGTEAQQKEYKRLIKSGKIQLDV